MQLRSLKLILALVVAQATYSQELTKDQISNYIFQIISLDCDRRLTGFMLEGKPGIITSLHGVLGCKDIVAQNVKGITFSRLVIHEVDIDHDIAVLISDEIESNRAGLPWDNSKIRKDSEIKIYPFSYGIDVIMDSRTSIREVHPMIKLKSITESNPEIFRRLNKRESPSLEIDVINLRGGLKPGASGAPITNKGKVIGVGTGEIQNRPSSDFSFGVPVRSLQFTSASDKKNVEDLNRIGSLPSEESLFLFESEEELNARRSALQGIFLPKEISSKRRVTVSIGSNVRITSTPLRELEVFEPFKFISPPNLPLKLKLQNGRLLVSCIIRSLDGKPIAEIIDNEWVVNPNNYFQRNYDKNGLEVIDEEGIVKFQVNFNESGDIEISGVFTDQRSIYFVSPMRSPSTMLVIGLASITKHEIRMLADKIPNMFVYPANSHLGERVKLGEKP